MNSIQGFGPMQGMQGMMGMMGMRPPAASLSDEQKAQVQSILSNYDPDNITQEDAQEIFQQLREAGIPPMRGLKEAIEEAGFDAEKLRQLGMPDQGSGKMPPPPPPQAGWGAASGVGGVNLQTLQSLQSILNQYDLANLTDEQQTSLMTQLWEIGLFNQGSLFDFRV
ncbi:MAG: hypothetical protein HPY45_14175 [Anaerolineae bacterium]|nr:hypothetical protein [Anaerolineae bacterium]